MHENENVNLFNVVEDILDLPANKETEKYWRKFNCKKE